MAESERVDEQASGRIIKSPLEGHPPISSRILDMFSRGSPGAIRRTQEEIVLHEKPIQGLREKARLFKAIFDSVQDGVSILDADFHIVSVNRIIREWYPHMVPHGRETVLRGL